MAQLMSQVLGHEKQKSRVQTMVEANRVPSSLIFVGPSGVGKRQIALSLAQNLLCERASMACGECGPCLRVSNQQSEALKIVEPKSGIIKIEQAREIIGFIQLRAETKHRVVLIDQAEKLNPQASNALLKSIEEPPEGVHFILVTDSLMSLLQTIRSRSQVIKFSPLEDDLVAQITGASGWVVKASGGRVTLAEELMDDSMSDVRDKAISYWRALLAQRQSPLEILKSIESEIKDRESCLYLVKFWQHFMRDVYLTQLGSDKILNQDHAETIGQWAETLSPVQASELSQQLQILEQDVNSNVDKMLSVESFTLKTYESSFGEIYV